eukprot:2606208-Amphidinium_carterae.1
MRWHTSPHLCLVMVCPVLSWVPFALFYPSLAFYYAASNFFVFISGFVILVGLVAYPSTAFNYVASKVFVPGGLLLHGVWLCGEPLLCIHRQGRLCAIEVLDGDCSLVDTHIGGAPHGTRSFPIRLDHPVNIYPEQEAEDSEDDSAMFPRYTALQPLVVRECIDISSEVVGNIPAGGVIRALGNTTTYGRIERCRIMDVAPTLNIVGWITLTARNEEYRLTTPPSLHTAARTLGIDLRERLDILGAVLPRVSESQRGWFTHHAGR